MSAQTTRGVVAAVIGAAMVWAVIYLTGWLWGAALTALLAYEGWTLANRTPHDTISEIVRAFARRQLLIPWLFGAGLGIALASGYLRNVYVVAAIALLHGHFFFTLDEDKH